MYSTPKYKVTGSQIGYKNRTHHFATHKKQTSATKIDTTSEYRARKKFSQANVPKKQTGVDIPISNKIDFQPK